MGRRSSHFAELGPVAFSDRGDFGLYEAILCIVSSGLLVNGTFGNRKSSRFRRHGTVNCSWFLTFFVLFCFI